MVGKALGVTFAAVGLVALLALPKSVVENVSRKAPAEGVKPTKKITELKVPESLGAKAYQGKHTTKHHEYMNVTSLTVMRGGETVTVVEHLYSHDHWDDLLALFKGLQAETREDVETLVAEIVSVVGPMVDPHTWDESMATPEPLPDGWKVRVSGRSGNVRHLVFEVDESTHEITHISISRSKSK